MADLGSASGRIEADATGFFRVIQEVKRSVDSLSGVGKNALSGLDQASKRIDDLNAKADAFEQQWGGIGAGLTGFGTVVFGGFAYAAKGAIDFEQAMANVNSIAQLSQDELAGLSTQVLDLAKVSGQGPITLAEGLYDIQSSGYSGADAMTVLDAAVNAANAGMTDTATSSRAITAVLNAYGLSADDARGVSDVLFKTVDKGVITFEQLANNMGNTLPIASSLGISVEELGGAYALMTKNGVPASQAETQIAAVMRSALNPTEALTTAVQEHGYSSAASAIEQEGLAGFLKIVSESAGGNKEALFDLLGTQEAMNAATLLGGDNLDEYNAMLAEMEGATEGAGATQAALEQQTNTTAFALKQLGSAFQTMRIRIGELVSPLVRLGAELGTNLINGFLNLSAGAQKVIAALAGIAGAVAGAAGGFMLLYPVALRVQASLLQIANAFVRVGPPIERIGQIFGRLGPAILRLINPIRAVSLAFRLLLGANPIFLALGAAILAFQTNFLGVRDVVGDVVDTVTDFADAIIDAWDAIGSTTNNPVSRLLSSLSSGFLDLDFGWAEDFADVLSDVSESVEDAVDAFQTMWDSFEQGGEAVSGVMQTINQWGNITEDVTITTNALSRVLYSLGAAFTAIDFPGVGAAFTALGLLTERLIGRFQAFRSTGLDPVSAALATLGATFTSLQPITQQLMSAVTDITAAFQAFMNGDFSAGFDMLGEAAGNAMDAIREIGSLASGLVVDLASWTINVGIPSVVGAAQSIWNAVRSWVTNTAWPAVSGAAITIGGVLVDIGSWLRNRVPDVFSTVAGWFTDVAWPAALGAAQTIRNALVNIGSWAQGTAPRVWSFITDWVSELVSTAGNVTESIQDVAINIGSWARGTAERLWPFISGWVDDLIATAGSLTKQIPSVTVRIADWIVTAFKTLQRAVEESVLAEGVSLSDVVVNILSFKPFLNEPIDQAIQDAIGSVLVSLSDVLVSITEPNILESAGELAATIGAAVLGLGIVLSALPLSLPIIVGIGLISLAIGAAFALSAWIAGWAARNPLDAVEVLMDIVIAMDNIVDAVTPAEGWKEWALAFVGLPKDGIVRVSASVVIDWSFGLFGDEQRAPAEAQTEVDFDQDLIFNHSGEKVLVGPDGNPISASDMDAIFEADMNLDEPGLQVNVEGGYKWVPKTDFQADFTAQVTQPALTALVGAGTQIGTAAAGIGTLIGQSAAGWGTALRAGTSVLPAIASPGFTGVRTAAQTGLGGVGTTIGMQTAQWPIPIRTAGIGIRTAATTAFGGVRTAAQLGIGGVGRLIGTQAPTWTPPIRTATTLARTALNSNMLGMRTSTAVNMAGIRTTTAQQTNAARASIVANSAAGRIALTGANAGMAANQLATWAGIAGTTSTQSAAMYSSTSTNATQSAVALAGQNAGMALNQTVTWGGIVGTAASQGSAMAAETGSAAGRAAAGMATGMGNATGAVASNAGRWAGIVSGAGGGMYSAGYGVGVQAGRGVASGMYAMLGSVRAAASSIVSAVNSALNAAARIASPSKLTMEHGRQLTAGVAVGIVENLRRVGNAAQRVVDRVDSVMYRGMRLFGVYKDMPDWFEDKYGRAEKGTLGGAIQRGWEKLTQGFYRNIETGFIRKGILAEDGTYVNPAFYDTARKSTKALERTATATETIARFTKGRQYSALTQIGGTLDKQTRASRQPRRVAPLVPPVSIDNRICPEWTRRVEDALVTNTGRLANGLTYTETHANPAYYEGGGVGRNGTTTITIYEDHSNNYALKREDYTKVIDDSERGGRVATSLGKYRQGRQVSAGRSGTVVR